MRIFETGFVVGRGIHVITLLFAATPLFAACGSTGSAANNKASNTASTIRTPSTTTSGIAPPTTTETIPAQPDVIQSPVVSGPVILRGNGIGNAVFGQPESAAIANLEKVLGPPTTAEPTISNNCTVDAFLQFPGIATYFDHKKFVGYATGSANGENSEILNVISTKGLKIGDTLAQAQQLYGPALTTSIAQGGSWFVKTSTGNLSGYLSAEANQSSTIPRIVDITSGSIGCAAATP